MHESSLNVKPMRVCLISTELAGIGSYGGFGFTTRQIAEGLSKRGMEVYIAMPRKPGQKPIERVDGLTVVSYPSGLYTGLKAALPFAAIYKMIDADIYHSQEPSLGTRLAQLGAPEKKHVITFRDPRTIDDWRKQWAPRQLSRFRLLRRFRELKFQIRYQLDVGHAVRKADARFCKARFVIERAAKIYKLKSPPRFLADPIHIPQRELKKADAPTVYFLGRWDPIKRPELFLELAVKYPHVKFIAMGACLNDSATDNALRKKYGGIPNIELPGWVESDEKSDILSKSWILINTSIKECLPVSYLEASAHKCAILSHRNADDFASNFGYWAKTGDIDDFARGLEFLLNRDRWRETGERGYVYMKNTYEFSKVIDQHIKVYNELLRQ